MRSSGGVWSHRGVRGPGFYTFIPVIHRLCAAPVGAQPGSPLSVHAGHVAPISHGQFREGCGWEPAAAGVPSRWEVGTLSWEGGSRRVTEGVCHRA